MKKKGISAVVGYTLLVGLAVALGAIVIVWSRGAAETQTETVLLPYANEAECAAVNYNVNFSFGMCKLRIYNSGQLKWERMVLATDNCLSDGYEYTDPVMPKEWAEIDLTGCSQPITVEVLPIIKSQGQEAKCSKSRTYSSGVSFSC
ncbi:hypothetical protein D6777_04190 [Candidatus Woesearchaeota archaeon]|nr:MAG: hypothetical protein D6777_04190 [Candidatus Woesearchaeota archaeon]